MKILWNDRVREFRFGSGYTHAFIYEKDGEPHLGIFTSKKKKHNHKYCLDNLENNARILDDSEECYWLNRLNLHKIIPPEFLQALQERLALQSL